MRAETLPGLRPWPEMVAPISIKGKRYYPCEDGVKRVSVTTVGKYIGIGTEALIDWAARTEKAATLEAVKLVYQWAGPDVPPDQFITMVEEHMGEAKAHVREKEKAADIGSQAHAMIQWTLRNEVGLPPGSRPPMSDPAELAFMAWEDWWRKSGLKALRVEQYLWHDRYGYAGQVDLIADGDGLELWDWKSSNYIVQDHHVQVAAYLNMLRLWRPEVTRAFLLRVPKKLDNIAIEIVPLGDTWDFKKRCRVQIGERELFNAFTGALQVYQAFGGPREIFKRNSIEFAGGQE